MVASETATKIDARLIVGSGPLVGRTIPLTESQVTEIGRHPKYPVAIPDTSVSKLHCVLVPTSCGYVVADRSSANGTWVNGQRVERQLLKSGDSIRVGTTSLIYSADEVDARIGTSLGDFAIESVLGSGGAGCVYRAKQRCLERDVAVKVLATEFSCHPEFVSRFLEEARAAARLTHGHVVTIHTVGKDRDVVFLVMEYLQGGSLAELVTSRGRLEAGQALRIGRDAARALTWSEQVGIVHRDIKPSNILLDERGRAKIADFGIAAEVSWTRSTRTKLIVGSPQYMAPEQARGESVDHRADIYALGATLYTVLSGRKPWPGLTSEAVLKKKRSRKQPKRLEKLAPRLPDDLAGCVEKMMSPDLRRRYECAGDALADLETIAARFEDEADGGAS
ncbi:MAG: FHA domain-containing serine/threonine-protein kinase [Planctomycetota bacterium]